MKILEHDSLRSLQCKFHDKRFQAYGQATIHDLWKGESVEDLGSLPIISLRHDEQIHSQFFLTIITLKKDFVIRFVTEMARKWVIPGKVSEVSNLCILDFLFADTEKCCLIEMSIQLLKDEIDSLSLEIFLDEIKLGLTSAFYAYKILSMKGLDYQDKLILVQDRILKILHRFSPHVDYDIIPFMQNLLFSFSETYLQFKSEIEIARIIIYFYLLSQDSHYTQSLRLKLKTSKQQTLFSRTSVLSTYAFIPIYPQETMFHKEKVILFLKSYFPSLNFLEDSFLLKLNKQGQSAFVSFDLECPSGSSLSRRDLELLRELITHAIEQSIRHLPKPVVIPSHREAVYKDLLHLADEVKILKDIPQIMITFEEIKDHYWIFTVLAVAPHDEWIQKLENADWGEGFVLQKEMVKQIGILRKRHPKMGFIGKVWIWPELELNSSQYGYYEVRKKVLTNLQKVLGPLRDYHGGMIEYQGKKLDRLKERVDPSSHFLIETFFLSIHQQEYLSLWSEEDLYHFFQQFQKVYKDFFSLSQNWHVIEDGERFIGYQTFLHIDECQKQVRRIIQLQIPSRLFLLASYQYSDKYFLGFMTKESSSVIDTLKQKVGLS